MNEFKLRDDRKTKATRSPLSQKIRWEVLRRDGFTCQYCGRHSGDGKELEIDHIVPVSKGGTNDFGNLLTACKECNRGKLTDEILAEQTGVKVIEKTVVKEVIKEVPVEKVVFIEPTPPANINSSEKGLKEWAQKEYKNDPAYWKDRALNGQGLIQQIAFFVLFESGKANAKKISLDFAREEMRNKGETIYMWAKQNDNPVLRDLAVEVITVAKQANDK